MGCIRGTFDVSTAHDRHGHAKEELCFAAKAFVVSGAAAAPQPLQRLSKSV